MFGTYRGLEKAQCPVCHRPALVKTKSHPTTIVCSKCHHTIPNDQAILAIQKAIDEEKRYEEIRRENGIDANLFSGPYIDDDDRKSMYSKVFYTGCFSFLAFYIFLCFLFPMYTLPWLTLIIVLIISRLADLTSTLIGLAFGAIETNPLSDPRNISKLLKPQVIQIIVFIGLSFLLGLISPWLRSGILLIYTFMGFEAAFSNLGQIFASSGTYQPGEDPIEIMTKRLLSVHVVAIFIVAIATFILLAITFI